MPLELRLHPDSHCDAISKITVAVSRAGEALSFTYRACGAIDQVIIPIARIPRRADELWRHTCFEAFLRGDSEAPYTELNFSSSGEWAAYAFSAYRTGMRNEEISAPEIDCRAGHGVLELSTKLNLTSIAPLQSAAIWRLALSCVIEEVGGQISYWALTHPKGKADFHHPDCFSLLLPATTSL